ncbi:hypothetical protein GCM10027346_20700 [Hymenobacter seoulensis]
MSQADMLKVALAKLHASPPKSNLARIAVEVESHPFTTTPAYRHVHFERGEGGEWHFKKIE